MCFISAVVAATGNRFPNCNVDTGVIGKAVLVIEDSPYGFF